METFEKEQAMDMFRKLSSAEIGEMVLWAKENYKPGDEINTLWHPFVRAECAFILYKALQAEAEKYRA